MIKNGAKKTLLSVLAGLAVIFVLAPMTARAATCCVCYLPLAAGDISRVSDITDPQKCKDSAGTYEMCEVGENEACPIKTEAIEPELKLGPISTQIKIPGLLFSPPPTVRDEAGNIYLPWIGEYIKAIYSFGLVALSILAVVVIIMQGAKVITSAGGSAKEEAYKAIAQAVIGLLIGWGSYVILATLNTNLTQFKSLQIHYVETVPSIDQIDEPVASVAAGKSKNGVPMFKQFDKTWGSIKYGLADNCTTIAQAGCGPTSLAMVLAFYNAPNATPDKVAEFVGQPGNGRVCNKGTSIEKTLSVLGQSQWSDFVGEKTDKDSAISLVKQNKPIIFLCKGCSGYNSVGFKTYTGHYMVLTDVNGDGNIDVNDPGANASKAIQIMTPDQLNDNGGFWYVHPK